MRLVVSFSAWPETEGLICLLGIALELLYIRLKNNEKNAKKMTKKWRKNAKKNRS